MCVSVPTTVHIVILMTFYNIFRKFCPGKFPEKFQSNVIFPEISELTTLDTAQCVICLSAHFFGPFITAILYWRDNCKVCCFVRCYLLASRILPDVTVVKVGLNTPGPNVSYSTFTNVFLHV